MVKSIKHQLSLLLIILVTAMQTEAADNQDKCQAKYFCFIGQAVMLEAVPAKARVFILHNRTKQTVLLDHLAPAPGASAGWSSTLSAAHWSALLVQNPPKAMAWTCAQMRNGSYQKVSCRTVLKICVVKVHPKSDVGTFWLSEDQISKSVLWQKIKLRKLAIED